MLKNHVSNINDHRLIYFQFNLYSQHDDCDHLTLIWIFLGIFNQLRHWFSWYQFHARLAHPSIHHSYRHKHGRLHYKLIMLLLIKQPNQ